MPSIFGVSSTSKRASNDLKLLPDEKSTTCKRVRRESENDKRDIKKARKIDSDSEDDTVSELQTDSESEEDERKRKREREKELEREREDREREKERERERAERELEREREREQLFRNDEEDWPLNEEDREENDRQITATRNREREHERERSNQANIRCNRDQERNNLLPRVRQRRNMDAIEMPGPSNRNEEPVDIAAALHPRPAAVDPLDECRRAGNGKVLLCKCYNVWINQAEITYMTRFLNSPNDMTRHLLKTLVGEHNLSRMCAKEKSFNYDGIPKDIMSAVECK